MLRRLLPILALLAGCSTPEEVPSPVTPAAGSMTGYSTLSIALEIDPADVLDVHIGGVRALHPTPADGALEVLYQGLPSPGLADVVVTTADGEVRLADAFEALPPVDGPFERVVAFGASLTQGVQDGTPTFEGMLDSPALALARQIGAYHPQPMLVPGLFPTLGLDTVGPAPDCRTARVPEFITGALTDVLPMLSYPEGGLAYELGRADPDLRVYNVSAGNFQVDDMLLGSSPAELPQNVLGALSFDLWAEFGAPPSRTMIEIVESLDPTLVVSFDLLGNDTLSGAAIEDMEANVPALVDRLAATGAEVFLSDMADPALLEGEIGSGSPSQRSERALAYNAILQEVADTHDNVHVVPFAAEADALLSEPLIIDGHELGMGMFGGMLSFDGLHFSSTGYAMFADLFARTINDALGTDIPPGDLASVLARDIHSPEAIRAAGRDPGECTGG